jgi:hypothetical protein
MTCAVRPPLELHSRGKAAYLRLSLSNTLGWLVGVPEVAEGPVVPVVVARDRPRMKYQTRPAIIARPMMIHNQGVPPSVVAGAAGEPGAAGGVAWARAAFTAPSVMIVKTWSLLSIMFPFRPQGLRINVGSRPRVPLTLMSGTPLPWVYIETVSCWIQSLSLRVVTAKERSPPTDLLIKAGLCAVVVS